MIHTKKLPRRLKEIKERMQVLSRPRSSGKVAAVAVGRGKYEQKGKRVFYKTIVNTCLSFSNGGKKQSGIE